jgi:tyrosine-protein kinase Etk/Wzc
MNQFNSTTTSSSVGSSDEFDIVEFLDVLLENRWLIAAIASAFIALGTAYAFLARPVYEAYIMVNVEDSPDMAAGKSLLGDVSSMFNIKSVAAGEAQILGSRLVVSRAVDNLLLYVDAGPRRFPVFGSWIARRNSGLSAPGLFGLGGYTWGSENISVKQFDVPKKFEGDSFEIRMLEKNKYKLSSSDLDSEFEGIVGAREVIATKEGPILLQVDRLLGQPGAMFDITRNSREQTIDELQNNLLIEERVKQSGVIIATLRDYLPARVAAILNEMGQLYVAQNVERKAAEAAQSLEFLRDQLPKAKQQLTDAQTKYAQFRDLKGTIDLDQEAKLALQQSVDFQTRLIELSQQRDEFATRFGPAHPGLIALDQQIASLKNQQRVTLSRIKGLPDVQQQAVRLMMDVQVNTDIYMALVNNIQQLELVRAGKVGNVRLVDVASIPEKPVRPRKVLVIVIALLLGGFVGVMSAFARSLLFRGVTDPAVLEDKTGLKVYATIPYSQQQLVLDRRLKSGKLTRKVLAQEFPSEPAVESLRSLRAAVQFAMLEAKNNIILLTGPSPGLGKSFVSVNLSVLLASAGRKVLLIDGDMRKGHLQQYFGLSRAGGLAELLLGTMAWGDVLRKNVAPNLDFISTGALPPNPAELASRAQLSSILTALSKEYDVIIFDTPPILVAADTSDIAPLCGMTFLLAYSGVTRTGEIQESVKRLAQAGTLVNGILFNGLSPTLGKYGWRYGSYRYESYSYGHEAID